MDSHEIYPRLALSRLEEALADTPVVLIHGPRQCGKSTLAKLAGKRHGHAYMTFDNEVTLAAARRDPVGFCAELPERVILDEVQRIPELFTSIKAAVDRDLKPGRIILTGSANILLLPKLSDSLAGRMEVIRLAPLAQAEIETTTVGRGFFDRLFDGSFPMVPSTRLGDNLLERVVRGGFPVALSRTAPHRRREWQAQYIQALVQRDLRDISKVRSLDVIPRLLELAAGQSARLFNTSELAAPFALSAPTVRDYLALLEKVFLIDLVQPWHHNRLSRIVKTPKMHLADTGLAAALLGLDVAALKADDSLRGQWLETFVFQELRRLATGLKDDLRFYHYRDKDKHEVDIVIERNSREIHGVEVKASSTVRESDFAGMRHLRDAGGKKFKTGVVLYDGESSLPFGGGFFAVPYGELWRMG